MCSFVRLSAAEWAQLGVSLEVIVERKQADRRRREDAEWIRQLLQRPGGVRPGADKKSGSG